MPRPQWSSRLCLSLSTASTPSGHVSTSPTSRASTYPSQDCPFRCATYLFSTRLPPRGSVSDHLQRRSRFPLSAAQHVNADMVTQFANALLQLPGPKPPAPSVAVGAKPNTSRSASSSSTAPAQRGDRQPVAPAPVQPNVQQPAAVPASPAQPPRRRSARVISPGPADEPLPVPPGTRCVLSIGFSFELVSLCQ